MQSPIMVRGGILRATDFANRTSLPPDLRQGLTERT